MNPPAPSWSGVAAAACIDEWRWRTRRARHLVAVPCAIALGATLGLLPLQGLSMVVIGGARVWPDSTLLAIGSASLMAPVVGLSGFYLLRGRLREELQCGVGQALAASPARASALLVGRWAAGVAWLAALAMLVALGVACAQAYLGEAPVVPATYLTTYALALLPLLMFVAACATLCDAWAPLAGQRGDLLYFIAWMLQLGTVPMLLLGDAATPLPALAALDVSGLGTLVWRLARMLGTTAIAVGASPFDARLPPVHLGPQIWTAALAFARLGAAALSLLPLALACAAFHRFSPDRVQPLAAAPGGSWLAAPARWLDALADPGARRLGAMWPLLARGGGSLACGVCADVVLALRQRPAAALLLPPLWFTQALAGGPAVDALAGLGALLWGLLLSEMSASDAQSGTSALQAVLPGGAPRQALRGGLAGFALGTLVLLPTLLRWSAGQPRAAAAALAGLAMCSALATLAARLTGHGRLFLVGYLVLLYAASQARSIAALDVLGFNGVATPASIVTQCAVAALAALATWRHAAAGP